MDQISNDVTELDNFIIAFLTGNSRASRDINRLHSLFSILKLVEETDLAETVQMSIIEQFRAKNLRRELSQALSKLSAHLKGRHKYDEALPLSEEALKICEEDHGAMYEDTAIQNMNLGTLSSCLSRYEKALSHFTVALDIYTALLGPTHVKTMESLHFVAVVHQDTSVRRRARARWRVDFTVPTGTPSVSAISWSDNCIS
jgi:tetratricopeptide (TPR) repeat protein